MLTSPLAMRQEPFARSVCVRTLGWRLSPKPCTSRLKQVDGVEQPVGEAQYRVQTRTRGIFPAQGESERMASCRWSWWSISRCGLASQRTQGVHVRYCRPLQRSDGYMYTKGAALPPQA